MAGVYSELPRCWPGNGWIREAARLAEHCLQHHTHGDLPCWRAALRSLPATPGPVVLDQPIPTLGSEAEDRASLRAALVALHPWRKGPFNVGGVHIDAEWRSDLKWQRVAGAIDSLEGRRVLDVGCGNGYYALRMADAGAAARVEDTAITEP